MGTSETLRSVIDAGRSAKRLDELSSARVIGKIAQQVHAAQQKAGAGKAIGPITPTRIALASTGDVTLDKSETNTLGYSAPEQITGGAGDRRSDVFSLGAVMWEVLTHQRLFEAMNDAAVKVAVQEREIKPPAEINANIPAELSAICMRALSRNPADRYQSLKAMAVEIEEFLEEAGYADNDTKIAQYLATIKHAPAAPAPSTPKQTQPPPDTLRPAAGSSTPPSILKDEPKPSAGAALAAKLASAGGTLPPVSTTATAVGVPAAPVASEWQDKAPPPVTPPAAAPTVPLTPLPPVLPSGSTTALRGDPKATINAVVAPPVKVATAEPDDKKATLVDSMAAVKAAEAAKAELSKSDGKANGAVNGASVDAAHATAKSEPAVEATPEVKAEAKAADAKAEAKTDAKTDDKTAKTDDKADAKTDANADAKTDDKVEAKADAKADAKTDDKAEAKVEAKTDKADAKTDAKTEDKADAKTEKATDKSTGERPKTGTGPHPASVVSLPMPGRESKNDLLAGWGWGTGAHEAMAPDGYVDHDEDFHPPHDSRKTLLYVIGGGVAVALLIVIIAFAGGGSEKKASKSTQTTATSTEATKNVASETTPPTETPTPVETAGSGSAAAATGSADTAGSGSAVIDPAAEQAAKDAAAKAAADQAAADKEAEAKRKADEEAAAKAAATQAKLDAEAAAAKAKADAEAQRKAEADAKKSEAERKKQEAAAAKQAEADRKKQEADAKRADAERKKAEDAAKKAEAKRIAQEEAAKKKAEQVAKAPTSGTSTKTTATGTTTKTRDKTATTTTKTVATAEPPKADTPKVDPDAAYRQGLQAFARGDTQAALTSLRSALSANPNHPPTWRGLGLVFEKMGEKDQAKAAYKRYLQLAPTAGDAEIIRGRLERLGS